MGRARRGVLFAVIMSAVAGPSSAGIVESYPNTLTGRRQALRDSAPSHRIAEPRWQLAVGLRFRTDERASIDAVPAGGARLYLFLTSGLAIHAGIGYCNSTVIGSRGFVETVNYEFGVRFQDRNRMISPYLEIGKDFRRYYGLLNQSGFVDRRGGLTLTAGLALALGRHGALDFSVHQVLNRIFDDFFAYSPQPIPESATPPQFQFWGFGPSQPRSLYNPTTIEVFYRFSL